MPIVDDINLAKQEVNIGVTARPYFAHINSVCSEDGYLKFGINPRAVDLCVGKIMIAIQDFKSDEVITAVGIAFILVASRFAFAIPSYLGFIENFLYRGDDEKRCCHAFQRMVESYLQEHLTRFETVTFKNTRTIKLNQQHSGQLYR